MFRRFLALVLLLGLGTSYAQAFSFQVINRTDGAIEALSLFPLNSDGEAIEDNLGGFIDALPAGERVSTPIDARCGPMLAVVLLPDGNDLRTTLDTCDDHTLVVSPSR